MTLRGSNVYLEELTSASDPSDMPSGPSEIAEFFAGLNVLVTGATGFMGKLLVEKLLRSCPDISKLYIIIRGKKGKSAEDRFKENFADSIYDRLRDEQPNFICKVIMLEGDVSEEDLGLSPESREILLNTNVIFHAAATVRFDEKLRFAININVRGVKKLLLLAKEMPNIKAFVHVSTAFAYCILKAIDEKHYRPPMDSEDMLSMVNFLDDETLEKMTPILIGQWPNTYAYTKALGEHIALRYSTGIPTCIIRPSIVVSTSEEPVPGWTNNLYGATGVVVGSALGLLRTLNCVPEYVAEIIPADYVIANIIAAAWDIGRSKPIAETTNSESNTELTDEERVPIYNTVTSCQNPISWGDFTKLNEIYGMDVPSAKVLWCYWFKLNRYLFLHNLYVFFLHTIPALIVDTLAYLIGRKPILLDAYRKIHKFSHVIHYFSTQEWRFNNDTVLKLWGKMNDRDRKIFNFHAGNLNWHDYFYYHIRGLRIYMVGDPLETIDIGRAKYRKLQIAHYTIITVVSLLLLWLLVTILSFIWSFCPLAN